MEKEEKKVEKHEPKKAEKKHSKELLKENKKLLAIAIAAAAVILVASVVFGITASNNDKAKDNGTKAITAAGVVKDETFKELKFTNSTLVKDNDIYTLTMDVVNTSKQASKITEVNIPIKDKDGNEIITLLGYIGRELAPDEKAIITASTSADLSGAYTKEITERKTE